MNLGPCLRVDCCSGSKSPEFTGLFTLFISGSLSLKESASNLTSLSWSSSCCLARFDMESLVSSAGLLFGMFSRPNMVIMILQHTSDDGSSVPNFPMVAVELDFGWRRSDGWFAKSVSSLAEFNPSNFSFWEHGLKSVKKISSFQSQRANTGSNFQGFLSHLHLRSDRSLGYL